MDIDINEIKDIKADLDYLKDNDVLYVNEDNKHKYVILPVKLYEEYNEILNFMNEVITVDTSNPKPQEVELSYEEYEQIKQQIIDALEATLMPKPEKLN